MGSSDINEYFARKMKEKKTNGSKEIPQTKIIEPKNIADNDLARDSVVIKVAVEVKKKKKSKKKKKEKKTKDPLMQQNHESQELPEAKKMCSDGTGIRKNSRK